MKTKKIMITLIWDFGGAIEFFLGTGLKDKCGDIL